MKDVRIVIVSWNVEKLLEQCLHSLPAACKGLNWECIVVDNDSKDQSVETALSLAKEIGGQIHVVPAGSNLGFAKACNLGAEYAVPGIVERPRYYLYLNPDTECLPDSLSRLIHIADARPKAGILGPRLAYPDGTAQESIRRFPTFLDQAGIILKLSHFLPKLNVFQRYFARDLDLNKEQSVDQVMGACFLVRGEIIQAKLGFDERYFIWMEEVDFCKTVKQKGWEVLYIPAVTVIHHQGKSFAQEFQPTKQKYFTNSLKKYFDKWHPGFPALGIKILTPIGQLAVWCLYASRQNWSHWLGLILAVEAVSFATLYAPSFMSVAAVLLAGLMAFTAWKRPWLAISALLLEMLVSSKGALLFVGEYPDTLALRIVLTAAFLFGWSLGIITSGEMRQRISHWKKFLDDRLAYVILAAIIVFALIRGVLLGNGINIVKDANAWMYLVMLLPLLDIVTQHGEKVERHIRDVLSVGLGWLIAKTVLVSYIFSHGLGIAPTIYPWIRRTGVGEVTLINGNFFRIFFQSHVYAILAALVFAARALVLDSQKFRWQFAGCVSILILCLSRSFWIGAATGGLLLIALTYKDIKTPWRATKYLGTILVLGFTIAIGSVIIPLPPVGWGSLGSVLGSRTSGDEAAVISRWNLLEVLKHKIGEHPILGSGFGATVTFETKDPRIVSQSGGTYTTYAFEWGWLEHWVKFGIIGIPLMAWIVISLARRIWHSHYDLWIRAAGVSMIFALAMIHVFTPYLNHPLGFTVLLFGEALIERSRRLIQ